MHAHREEHREEAHAAGELPPREVPLHDEGHDERLDAREGALERRVEKLGWVLQQQGPLPKNKRNVSHEAGAGQMIRRRRSYLLYCPQSPYHDRRGHEEDAQRPVFLRARVHGRAGTVQERVVVQGLELGALVQRQRDHASDAQKYPRGFGHAVDALQLQSLHPTVYINPVINLLVDK